MKNTYSFVIKSEFDKYTSSYEKPLINGLTTNMIYHNGDKFKPSEIEFQGLKCVEEAKFLIQNVLDAYNAYSQQNLTLKDLS